MRNEGERSFQDPRVDVLMKSANTALGIVNASFFFSPEAFSSGGLFFGCDRTGRNMFAKLVPRGPRRDETDRIANSGQSLHMLQVLHEQELVVSFGRCIQAGGLLLGFDGFKDDACNQAFCLLVAVWSELLTLDEALAFENDYFARLHAAQVTTLPRS